jgi:hypothetical protein
MKNNKFGWQSSAKSTQILESQLKYWKVNSNIGEKSISKVDGTALGEARPCAELESEKECVSENETERERAGERERTRATVCENPTPYTLHPTPYTPHSATYTQTPNPKSQTPNL